MIHKAIQGLLGRKTLIGLITISVGICLEMFLPNGLSPEMLALLQFVSVGFFLGNGMEHVSEAIKKKKPINSDVMKLEDTLRKIQQAQLVLSDQVSVNQQQTAHLTQNLTRRAPGYQTNNTDEQY